jgi:hypothetical protein
MEAGTHVVGGMPHWVSGQDCVEDAFYPSVPATRCRRR